MRAGPTHRSDRAALPVLQDRHARTIRYLRVSLTDRCNYRCTYCVPAGGFDAARRSDLLEFEEIERVVGVMVGLGVERIRLTGGEPLVRRGVVDLVATLAAIPGLRSIAMTTNGHLLEAHAEGLRRAGLDRLNISLDTLDPTRFAQVTRGGDLARVIRGIEAAEAAGFGPIKINTVVAPAINGDALPDIAEDCWLRGRMPRFIEMMPMGGLATAGHSAPWVLERLRARWPLVETSDGGGHAPGPARIFEVAAGRWRGAQLGLIAPMSDSGFCSTCNRARLTARGGLRACLADDGEVSVRDALRRGASDADLVELIALAIGHKARAHSMNTAGGPLTVMTGIGG